MTRRRTDRSTLSALRAHRWFALLSMTRILGALVGIALLLVHPVTHHDPLLALVTLSWAAISLLILRLTEDAPWAPAIWALDGLAALGLVLAGDDWRSPFYVFALTTLILPATALPWRTAVAWGLSFSACYGLVALLTEKLPADTLTNTIRLETLATHLFVPVVVTSTLAYSSVLLGRLRAACAESERLALQSERQRIAWELHDSAKQRVHAAHLMLSALTDTASTIDVTGRLPALPPLVAAHAYRIAAEALTNAVRHAACSKILVTLDDAPEGMRVEIADDGVGMPAGSRAGGHGLRSMHGRAETIGANLHIGPGPGGRGTSVALALPHPGGTS